MNEAVIEFGSNIDPEINISKSKQAIKNKYGIIKESIFLETKAVGDPNQPNYINGAVLLQTNESKEDFSRFLKSIESDLGRDKNNKKYAPREIDLDIIVWNGKVIHNDFYERDFVKENVLEVLPEANY